MKINLCLWSLATMVLLSAQVNAQQPFEPTPEHKVMMQEEGTWAAKGKMWMPETDEPTEFEATETNRVIGGMWVVSDFDGNFFGQPFIGHSTLGYDMDSKKYVGTWFDSMTPYMSKMVGTYDAATKTMTFNSMSTNPETGKPAKGKNVVVYKDKNTRHMTIYSENPESPGEMMKSMEIVYTRKNQGSSTK